MECWDHRSGKSNPADIPSRGSSSTEVSVSDLWKHGPNWLHNDLNTALLPPEIPEACAKELKYSDSKNGWWHYWDVSLASGECHHSQEFFIIIIHITQVIWETQQLRRCDGVSGSSKSVTAMLKSSCPSLMLIGTPKSTVVWLWLNHAVWADRADFCPSTRI